MKVQKVFLPAPCVTNCLIQAPILMTTWNLFMPILLHTILIHLKRKYVVNIALKL